MPQDEEASITNVMDVVYADVPKSDIKNPYNATSIGMTPPKLDLRYHKPIPGTVTLPEKLWGDPLIPGPEVDKKPIDPNRQSIDNLTNSTLTTRPREWCDELASAEPRLQAQVIGAFLSPEKPRGDNGQLGARAEEYFVRFSLKQDSTIAAPRDFSEAMLFNGRHLIAPEGEQVVLPNYATRDSLQREFSGDYIDPKLFIAIKIRELEERRDKTPFENANWVNEEAKRMNLKLGADVGGIFKILKEGYEVVTLKEFAEYKSGTDEVKSKVNENHKAHVESVPVRLQQKQDVNAF